VTPRLTLEIAVGTPDEALEAGRAGADRLELSSALDVGGVTPSLALFRGVRDSVRVPLWVLVRPRPGGFAYSEREFAVMRADA
jgi:copper homeostasis protein